MVWRLLHRWYRIVPLATWCQNRRECLCGEQWSGFRDLLPRIAYWRNRGTGNWKDMVLASLAWPSRQDLHDNPHDKWRHTSWHLSPEGCQPRCYVQILYIVSCASRLLLMSNCSPSVSRTTSSVFNCGLPSPRSMATTVLIASPARSAKVRWSTFKFFRLSLIVFPISSCVIIPIYCDFSAKVHRLSWLYNKNRKMLRFLWIWIPKDSLRFNYFNHGYNNNYCKRSLLLHFILFFCTEIWLIVAFLVGKFGIVKENYVICAA